MRFKLFDKTEFKIFLTFFIIYVFFIHYVGWYEQTKLLSAISLVDEKKIEIDSYANLTGDRAYYNNHYYSDQVPGTSFLLTSVYSLSKILSNDKYQPMENDKTFLPQPQFNTTIFTDVSPGATFQLTNILGTILLSSLPGALIVMFIYKILLNITKDENTSLITSIIFGLGTIIFSYSTVLMGNILPLLIILLAFYLSFIKKDMSKRTHLLNGVLLGFSIVLNVFSVIFSFLFFVFLLKKIRRNIAFFILGGLIGIMPLIIYNFLIFHNPFAVISNFITYRTAYLVDPQISPCRYGKIYSPYCFSDELQDFPPFQYIFDKVYVSSYIVMELLVYPYRGLFVYMPFLFLSFFGFKNLYRKNKELVVFILLLFFGHLVAVSFYGFWYGGTSFGSRYLLNSIPFLSIPLVYFIQNNKRPFLKIILVVLVSVSIFHMLLGTSANWESIIFYFNRDLNPIFVQWYTKTFWSDTIATLNPLYEHYFPAFLDHGPITRLFDGIIQGEIPDIRDRPYSANNIYLSNTPFGIVYIRSNIFGLFLLLVAIVVIWRNEINKLRIG